MGGSNDYLINEVSQMKTNIIQYHLNMESKTYTNELFCNREIDL